MNGSVRIVMRPGALDDLERDPAMVRMLAQRAGDVVGYAQTIAPRGNSPEADSYRAQIQAEVGTEGVRTIARVNANKFTSHWIEFGTIRTRAHAVLRRAAALAGLRLTGGRK